MAGGYSQHFTLQDIFNNKKLRKLFPLVNYKETEDDEGKTHRTTRMKTLSRFVYDKSVSAARPFYDPLVPHKAGDTIIIGGNLVEGQDDAVEAIYAALVAAKPLMDMTVNNADMIRSALKEGAKGGNLHKLYLRQVTMEQIEALDEKGAKRFMQDVMENLFFSDDYPMTKKKYGVESMGFGRGSYEQNKARWERKVGAL